MYQTVWKTLPAPQESEDRRRRDNDLVRRAEQMEQRRGEHHESDSKRDAGDDAQQQRLPRDVGRGARTPFAHAPTDVRHRADSERPPDREHEKQELERGADRRDGDRAQVADEREDRRLPRRRDEVLDDARPRELERGPLRMQRRELGGAPARDLLDGFCFGLFLRELCRRAHARISIPAPSTTSPISVAVTR